jgi:hypothetical protein
MLNNELETLSLSTLLSSQVVHGSAYVWIGSNYIVQFRKLLFARRNVHLKKKNRKKSRKKKQNVKSPESDQMRKNRLISWFQIQEPVPGRIISNGELKTDRILCNLQMTVGSC